MTPEQAVTKLANMARGHLEALDGEFGCCHDFDQMLSEEYVCTFRAEALEVIELERAALGRE